MLGEKSTAKHYHPVSLLSAVCKIFEKLENNRILNHLEKSDLFSDFHCSFRSPLWFFSINCRSSDCCIWRNVGVFSRSGATRAVAPDISKAFDRVWHAVLLKSYEIFGHIFDTLFCLFCSNFIWVIDSFRWFWMGIFDKNTQLTLEFVKTPFLVLHFPYYTLMTFLMMLSVRL